MRARSPALAAIAAGALAGCPDDEPCPTGWRPLAEQLPGAVLAAQGTGDDDVWLVGGGLGAGGALVRHWDGAAWSSLDPGRAETLWWVWPGTPAAPGAWFVGEQGLVLRMLGGAPAVVASGTTATLYGVWGSGPDDVWIVGGIPNGSPDADDDLVLHWDGASLTRQVVPVRGAALFKVWGAGADAVWVVGEGGTVLRWDGATWTDQSAALATPARLLTVHGCGADEVYVVGGQALWRWDGAAWAMTDAPITSLGNGVACAAGQVVVVGSGGLKLRRDAAGWHDDRLEDPWQTDFHGAWIGPDGVAWAVGGNFAIPAPTTRVGVVGVRGCPGPDPLQ